MFLDSKESNRVKLTPKDLEKSKEDNVSHVFRSEITFGDFRKFHMSQEFYKKSNLLIMFLSEVFGPECLKTNILSSRGSVPFMLISDRSFDVMILFRFFEKP